MNLFFLGLRFLINDIKRLSLFQLFNTGSCHGHLAGYCLSPWLLVSALNLCGALRQSENHSDGTVLISHTAAMLYEVSRGLTSVSGPLSFLLQDCLTLATCVITLACFLYLL